VGLTLAQAVWAQGPETWVQKAREKHLAQDRYWHLLLHYEPSLWGGFVSQIDDPTFFLSPEGKTDPVQELEANLVAFFRPALPGEAQAPRCRFIARYTWILEQLGEGGPEPVSCPLFETWEKALAAQSVTLVFPTYDLFAPGSMFGHTLLRIDSAAHKQTPILDFGVSYAAAALPELENPIVYPIYGIFGGYRGLFAVVPYYQKVNEYRDLDIRDIWEYPLDLTPEEVARLVRHTWELGWTYADYFYFRENCSFHLLSLIEAARPSLRLQAQFPLWAAPPDTVRAVLAAMPGTGTPVYRPSRYTLMRDKLDRLTDSQRSWLVRLLGDRSLAQDPDFLALPPASRAMLLELLYDRILLSKDEKAGPEMAQLRSERAALGYIAEPHEPKHLSTPGGLGHQSSKAGVNGGQGLTSPSGEFLELWARLSFHDLLDDLLGYPAFSGIEFGRLRVRQTSRHWAVEELTLLRVQTFWPSDLVFQPLAWQVRLGWMRDRQDCLDCLPLALEVGLGRAFGEEGLMAWTLLGGRWKHSRFYPTPDRLALGPMVGLVYRPAPHWSLGLELAALVQVEGSKEVKPESQAQVAYHLGEQWELRLGRHQGLGAEEASLGISAYW